MDDTIGLGISSFPQSDTSNAFDMPPTTTTAEQWHIGRVTSANSTPPSLTVVPDDRTTGPDYPLVFSTSHARLADFLSTYDPERMRVSYALRLGPAGRLVVEGLTVVGAGEGGRGLVGGSSASGVVGEGRVKRREKKAGGGGGGSSGVGNGAGEGRVRKLKGVLPRVGFVASQPDRFTLEEEARRNARGEFRNRNNGLNAQFRPTTWDEWSAAGERERTG